jgi:predicted MPP superfamily phosphohydrolase
LKRGIGRRRFLATAASVVAGTLAYGFLGEPKHIRTTAIEIGISDLPASWDGLRIVQLSDFHRGKHVDEQQVAKAGEIARGLSPDLVVLTGDFVTGSASFIGSCLDALGRIPSPLGTFAVLGNHDWWTNGSMIREALQEANIHVLSNAAVRLGKANAPLWLLGVEDLWSPAFSLNSAVHAVEDSGSTILLCHNPDVLPRAAKFGLDLVLSGHTHGGQVCLPGIGALMLPIEGDRSLARGLHQRGPTQIFITTGIGLVSPPIRINCPPEVAAITLRSRPTSQIA